jgi:signal transduction histidine kinase
MGTRNGKIYFTVDSHLLGELGERLVTRNHVALSELVKNSYDADATEVVVEFQDARGADEGGEIVIQDNGHGMTFGQVRDFWMRVATANKTEEPTTPRFGRTKTGNKGIGRFACQRLAANLELVAKGKLDDGRLETTTLRITWSDFKRGSTLTQIPSKVETRQSAEGQPGLTLRLKNLRDTWTQRDVDVLRRQLLTLTVAKGEKRRSFDADPGFVIVLKAEEFDSAPVPLAEQFMDAGWGRLRSKVSKSGVAEFHLEAQDVGQVRYTPTDQFPLLEGVQLDLAIIPRRKEYFRDQSVLTTGSASGVLDTLAGVRVYFDGFRVYPYGDEGDDWLEIDKDVARNITSVADPGLRRLAAGLTGVEAGRALLHYPKNQNLVGGVYLQSNPDGRLTVKSNREGFVESEATVALRKLCRLALDWATLYYSQSVFLHFQSVVKEAERELRRHAGASAEASGGDPLRSAVGVLTSTMSHLSPSSKPEEIRSAKEVVSSGIKVIGGYMDQFRLELSTLRVTASSGAVLLAFTHEVRGVVASLGTISGEIEDLAESLPPARRKAALDIVQLLSTTRGRLENQLSLFGVLARQGGVLETERVPVGRAIEELVKGFDRLLNAKVSVDFKSIPPQIQTIPMYRGEFTSIIINLLTNSIKAVLARGGEREGIRFEAGSDGGSITIDVYDDGVELPADFLQDVPRVFTADPENVIYTKLQKKLDRSDMLLLGEGTGLGLSVVRSILASYGGTIHFTKATAPWTKCCRISLPR